MPGENQCQPAMPVPLEVGVKGLICTGVADVRQEPDPTSELVNQALLGTPARVSGWSGRWLQASLPDYQGWIPMVAVALPKDPGYWAQDPLLVVTGAEASLLADPDPRAPTVATVYFTTVLKELRETDDWHSVLLPDGQEGWVEGQAVQRRPAHCLFPQGTPNDLLATARRFIGTPYLWGGLTPRGWDCSGFVQIVYKAHGYALPRDAGQQLAAPLGSPVERSKLAPADLVFFGEAGKVTHVALYRGEGEYIHATGRERKVVVNSFDPSSPLYRQDLDDMYVGARRIAVGP